MTRWVLLVGGIFAGMAVMIGAFGAHGLKAVLDPKALGWVETGAQYQTTHALALLACGLFTASKSITVTAVLFIMGILLFSGSLYVMAMTGNVSLGMITPLGGVLLIGGWISFCISVWKTT